MNRKEKLKNGLLLALLFGWPTLILAPLVWFIADFTISYRGIVILALIQILWIVWRGKHMDG